MRRAIWFAVFVLITGSVAEARSGAEKYDLLPKTPPSCEPFFYGKRVGVPYDGITLKLLRQLIHARYDIHVHGLDEILARGKTELMLWPNHLGPLDPLIQLVTLPPELAMRPVMTEDMLTGPLKALLKAGLDLTNGFTVPSLRGGATAAGQIDQMIAEWLNAIAHGDNVMFYPSGAIQIGPFERLGAKSAAHTVLKKNPNQRVILARVEGLEGSSFTHSGPQADPNHKRETGKVITDGGLTALEILIGNLFVNVPKRRLDIYYSEPTDLPRKGKVEVLNKYLEDFYNQNLENRPRKLVKKFWGYDQPDYVTAPNIDYGKVDETPTDAPATSPGSVRPETMKAVFAAVKATLGIDSVTEDTNLLDAADSLRKLDLLGDIEARLNVVLPDDSQFATPGELAAMVEAHLLDPKRSERTGPRYTPSPGYLANPSSDATVQIADGDTNVAIFVNQALAQPNKVISEDIRGGSSFRAKLRGMRIAGALVRGWEKLFPAKTEADGVPSTRNPLTYAKSLKFTVAISRVLRAMDGPRVATLLPASAGGTMFLMAAQLAGKDPVQVNFTTPPNKIVDALETIGIDKIITSRAAIQKISKSYDVSAYEHRFVYIEDLKYKILRQLPAALFQIKHRTKSLIALANRAGRAAVLFTSGSTGTPKAVPLTHANVLANVKDLVKVFKIHESDRLLCFLPPFHSFGNMLETLSLTLGVPTVYHPEPQDAQTLNDLTESYKSTIVVGTSTFVTQMARRGRAEQFDAVRLVVVGAEELTRMQHDEIKAKFRNAAIVEGYGLTEMSPVVAVNPPEKPKLGSVGRLLPSLKKLIVDPETMQPVKRGEIGFLLVSGPSMFEGYLNSEKDPFVTIDGVKYFNTEDLFHEDEDDDGDAERGGYLFIHARQDRMRKINGEKVSLQEIENTIAEMAEPLRPAGVDGPLVVVESTCDNAPLILFTTVPLEHADVQAYMREKQLKGVNAISETRRVDAIPMLGVKIDYQTLRGECGDKKGEDTGTP